ncbi:MAG: RagB/SusD family nutrient uptake outer membrane protein [Prevotella sp.]|nr:RagB/SusD family nutrient uptake outer membrane protein [Prevotella sp.]
MKLYRIALALMLGIGTLTSCSDKLELSNPNQPTTGTFGNSVEDLEEAVIACYHHIRMEGTYARVGYTLDVLRGDEAWNVALSWGHYGADNLNYGTTGEFDAIGDQWIWRDWYYVINIANFVITKCEENGANLSEAMKRIKGQALFARGLAYYNLSNYYQNPALILNYNDYSTLDGLYASNKEEGDTDGLAQYDRVLDQVEIDLAEAMTLLPSRDEGGEWAKGRATSGAAAGIYARALMQRHKYSEALTVLKAIIGGTYGTYKLMANYGDNFREGSAYENNDESLYEIQYLDYGSQGSNEEWTPVNITEAAATQGHAVESNYGPAHVGSWQDIAAAPWLYHLFKAERTTSGSLDPRLYWTIGTYEPEWEGFEYGNMCYTEPMTADEPIVVNGDNGGLPIAKWTNFRTGLYNAIVTGLRCGINLRIMRYSDVLLRAAECENEVNGPTQQAIDWINQVRNRAHLANLNLSDFNSKDKLFEQIANVERPKEFGCEYGRGFDLLRWGFFYDNGRLQQLKEHGAYRLAADVKDVITYGDTGVESTYDKYQAGHEYFPIFQTTLNDNTHLVGNSANNNTDNSVYFSQKGWTVHPVVDLSK